MSGTAGLFTKKIYLKAYFDNASGLREGAPVRLNGVDIGNVVEIRIVRDKDKQLTPVQVTMKVSSKYRFNLRKDSLALLSTAGVLGETYIDIDSSQAKSAEVESGDTLLIKERPDFQDMVRSGQSTLQNMDALLKRADRIIAFVESGQGSIGKLIYDDKLYKQLNTTVAEFQGLVNQVARGEGTLGKLLRDPALFNNADQMLIETRQLVKSIRENPKKYLTIHFRVF